MKEILKVAPSEKEAIVLTRPLETPVAMFVFNRPETTRKVFARVAEARPRHLLLVADGPREGRADDRKSCAEVREIVERIDWECTVERNFAEANLGCRDRVSSGLDWVFSRCDRAIILEDDCLPDPTFFPFCEELLERYRDDARVMMVSGDDFLNRPGRAQASYRFSGYAHIWGWATWARAWRAYDVTMSDWPDRRPGGVVDLNDKAIERYWKHIFDRTYSGEIDTWDYQWVYACLARGGLCIVPEGNLVSNIGFGAGATNHAAENHLSRLETEPMHFPLRHPIRVERDRQADHVVFRRVFTPIPTFRNRISHRLRLWREGLRGTKSR